MTSWHAKAWGSYSRTSTEGLDNATLICSWLMRKYNWTFEACCGMLGNIASEGGMNPWQYEIAYTTELGRLPTVAEANSTGYGMGLIGWTPCRKYTDPTNSYFPEYNLATIQGYGPNFYDRAGNTNDGHAQTDLIGKLLDAQSGRGHRNFWIFRYDSWSGKNYNMRGEDYKVLTDMREATNVWLWEAEYPLSIHGGADPRGVQNYRYDKTLAWYNALGGSSFQPVPDPVESLGSAPWWIILFKLAAENL